MKGAGWSVGLCRFPAARQSRLRKIISRICPRRYGAAAWVAMSAARHQPAPRLTGNRRNRSDPVLRPLGPVWQRLPSREICATGGCVVGHALRERVVSGLLYGVGHGTV